jgi:hypothetical protein
MKEKDREEELAYFLMCSDEHSLYLSLNATANHHNTFYAFYIHFLTYLFLSYLYFVFTSSIFCPHFDFVAVSVIIFCFCF